MKMTSKNLMFFIVLFLSIFVTISTNSMIWMWFFMEVNTMMILPIMLINNSLSNSQQIMKFFIMQAISSNFLLVLLLLLKQNFFFMENAINMMMILTLCLKMGIAPMHFWVLNFVEDVKWMALSLFLTIQKMIPFFFFFFIHMKKILMILIFLNILFGSLMGLNQYSLRKIMVFSSMNHMSWMILSMTISLKLFKIYFTFYTIMTFMFCLTMEKNNLSYVSQMYLFKQDMKIEKSVYNTLNMKMMMFFMGLPPMLGFIPKILIILKSDSDMVYLLIFMVLVNLFSVMYYLRLIISFFMNSGISMKPMLLKKNYLSFKDSFFYMTTFTIFIFFIHKMF